MDGESPPEKRMRLQDASDHEQDEIKMLVKLQEEMLASSNKKLLEMEESKNKAEREKKKMERDKLIVEIEKMELEEKLQNLIECPVCLTLPRAGPVPCCANGHFVCSPCLGKLREENKQEQA